MESKRNVEKRYAFLESLIERFAFLENLINASPYAIVATDKKGEITLFNWAAERLTGYKGEEVIGKLHITHFYPLEVAKDIMKKLRSEGGRLTGYLLEWTTKDGQKIPGELWGALIYDERGEELGSIGLFNDLRERIKIEAELKRFEREVIQAEKLASIGKLLASVVHEVLNPLNIIHGRIQILKMEEFPTLSNSLGIMAEQIERITRLLNSLLQFSRPSLPKKEEIAINTLLEKTVSLVEYEMERENIKIIKEFSPHLFPIKGDSDLLMQVFLNIIQNGRDAMPQGGSLRIATLKEKDSIEISFTDTGCGIATEDLPKIFDPFFTTKEVGKGTGLGLSTSYKIIQDHQGKIEVKSTLGQGTTFTIKLPLT